MSRKRRQRREIPGDHPMLELAQSFGASSEDLDLIRERLETIELFGSDSATAGFLLIAINSQLMELWAGFLRSIGDLDRAEQLERNLLALSLTMELPAELAEVAGLPDFLKEDG